MTQYHIAPRALEELILSNLEKEFNQLAQQAIDEAVDKYRKDLQDRIGNIALRMLKTYEVRTANDRLIIEVRNEVS